MRSLRSFDKITTQETGQWSQIQAATGDSDVTYETFDGKTGTVSMLQGQIVEGNFKILSATVEVWAYATQD